MHTIDWDDQVRARAAWGWLPGSLGRWATVGGNLPSGYDGYVSIPNSLDPQDNGCSLMAAGGAAGGERDQLDRVLDVVGPVTGDQPVHCAIWEGFGGMFREADGTVGGATLLFSASQEEGDPVALAAEHERVRREWVGSRPLRPGATTLHLPHRDYYTWTTTLDLLRADAELLDGYSPTIVAPADRSWLWHSEIDARRTDVAGPARLVAQLLGAPSEGFVVDRETALGDVPGWPSWSQE